VETHHLAAGIGEMYGIADQVQRDLTQRACIGDDLRQHMRQRGADDDAFAGGLRLHHRDATLDHVVEVLVGEGEVEPAGLDPAEIGEVVDDGDDPFAEARMSSCIRP